MPIAALVGGGHPLPPAPPSDPPVTPPTDDQLLDLQLGIRVAGFRFDLLDAANRHVGTLDVDVTDGYPRITNNINRTIKRTLDNLVLPPAQVGDVNPLVHRVQPYMVFSNGSEFPLGIFLWADDTRRVHSFGSFGYGQMVDQGLILDQPSEKGAGYARGTHVAAALEAEFTKAGLTLWDIDPDIDSVIGEAIGWPAGTHRSQIAAELCNLASAYSPFFSNAGLITVRKVDDLSTATPDLSYYTDVRSRVLEDTITEGNNVLDAPNRYIVIDGSAPDSPVVAYYDVPASAPHSKEQRGFVVATVINENGLPSVAAALARAQAAYGAGKEAALQHVSFSSPPDPRHDTFQIVAYNDVKYREQEWVLTCQDGSDMTHQLRRSYQPGEAGTEVS